jgi:hypothetical protein
MTTENQPLAYEDFCAMLAEGFHTAFRKATDHSLAVPIHHLIRELPRQEWAAVVLFTAQPLWELLHERGITQGNDNDDGQEGTEEPPQEEKAVPVAHDYLLVKIAGDVSLDRLRAVPGVLDVEEHGSECCCQNCPWNGDHGRD